MTAEIYRTEIDLSGEDAHALLVDLVGSAKRVLEAGCAGGSVTKHLAARGCRVVGIELDAEEAEFARQHAERVVVADLDDFDPAELAGDEGFDVITFGDVLEHLRDPAAVLRSFVQLLDRDGCVVISVPNIAHADVRLSLLAGRFDYRPTGLLDRTHLRFFTRTSLRELLASAGLVPVETRRVIVPVGGTELEVDIDDFPAEVLDVAMADPEAETYQFVVKAVRDGAATAVAGALDRLEEIEVQRRALEVSRALAEAEAHRLASKLHTVEAELRDVHIESRSTFANLSAELERHRAEQERARKHIATLESNLAQRRSDLPSAARLRFERLRRLFR